MNVDNCFDEKRFFADIINRFLGCAGYNEILSYGNISDFEENIYPTIKIRKIESLKGNRDSGILFVNVDNRIDWNDILNVILTGTQIIIYVNSEIVIPERYRQMLETTDIKQCIDSGSVYCFGREFCYPSDYKPPKDFNVLAIVHFYNEEDIIRKTVEYLLKQGLYVYLVDNWSSDDSYKIACDIKREYPEKVFLERFPDVPTDYFMWYEQLERTEEISVETDFDWYIHYDMDELRETPWKGINIRSAIAYIDSLGYNCIENTVIDFRMTRDDDQIFGNGEFFDFRYEYHWIDQLKTWKSCKDVKLKPSGGHHAIVANPRIFPLKFLNKHYPLRSWNQATRKVNIDRLPRFKHERNKRGWHTQYDQINETGFVYNSEELIQWNEEIRARLWITLFTECGLNKEREIDAWDVPRIRGRKIGIYGAGRAGRYACIRLAADNEITAWVDRNYDHIPLIYCLRVLSPEMLKESGCQEVVVAVISADIQIQIRDYLISIGFDEKNIHYVKDVQ